MAINITIPAHFADDKKFVEEWTKMQLGQPYNAFYPPFSSLLMETRKKIQEFNSLAPDNIHRLKELITDMLGSCGGNVNINQPFRCDFGFNIHVGKNFFANFNLTILDEAQVIIGDNVFIGPNTSIYTACHPLDPEERNKGIEWAEPVKIGNNVWIGGNATILPGVSIGDNTSIGAGSVVSRDIPSNCVAVGNPCRIIRNL